MEIEIKLQLPDAAAHAKTLEVLAPHRKASFEQTNYFFDSPDGKMSANRKTLRVRFYKSDAPDKAVLTVKGRQEMRDGVGRATEVEDELDLELARRATNEPSHLLKSQTKYLQEIKSEVGLTELVCLGNFKNNRSVFEWEGLEVEVDETIYSPTASHPEEGRFYEIELETDEPETFKPKLEALLREHNIPFNDGVTTKFARFRSRQPKKAAKS